MAPSGTHCCYHFFLHTSSHIYPGTSSSTQPPHSPHFRYHELQSAHMAQAQMVNQSESGRAAPYMNTIKTQEQVESVGPSVCGGAGR